LAAGELRENNTPLQNFYVSMFFCTVHCDIAISLFRNRLLSRATKVRLYKTVIRPAVTYGAETWTMTKKDEQGLLLFERKIFRRIYGLNTKMGNGKLGRIEN